MNDAQCLRCLNRFRRKDIYTIQQFQYRKTPSYEWTVEFFSSRNIGEWDSFCEKCMLYYQNLSHDEFMKMNA